jgi:acetyltransferase-like isoleucine patch superfamily enzyme
MKLSSEIIPGFECDIKADTTLQLGTLKGARDSTLKVSAENCSFSARDGVWLRSARFIVESRDSTIHLEPGVYFTGSMFLKGNGSNNVWIGSGSTFGQVNIICSEGTSIRIGDDCMFAWGIEVRTTDSHGIYDLDTNERINIASDVEVGSHVWVAAKASILKGSVIPSGCVVGMNSVVTKVFEEENAVLIGNPARAVRTRIKWERPLLG